MFGARPELSTENVLIRFAVEMRKGRRARDFIAL